MSLRFQAGSSSLYIAPVFLQEEAAAESPNHNRSFCSLYLALEKKVESKEIGVKKKIVSRIKERAATPTLRQRVTSR